MSLSFDDLQSIRAIMRQELKPLEDRVEALENDVKAIYLMMSDLQKEMRATRKLVKS